MKGLRFPSLVELSDFRQLAPRDIVVLTDRYPPDAFGGAEVSLHIFLKELASELSILVVALGDRTLVPRKYTFEGVDVVVLPRGARAPMQRLPHAVTLTFDRLPRKVRAPVVGATKRLLLGRAGTDREQEAELLRALVAAKPRGGLVVDGSEFRDAYPVRLLRRLLTQVAPRILHCDNYRSIMLAEWASPRPGPLRIGVVRDNRFTCTRYDQSHIVDGIRCTACDFRCAEVDLPTDPALQRRALTNARARRMEALASMDRLVVTSTYLRESLEPIVGADKIDVVPNAPDDDSLVRDALLGVAQLPGTNVLTVGMLNENKGQLDLVDALPELVERVPDIMLHFAGRGERLAEAIRRSARDRGVEDRIVFHGYLDRDRLYQLYAECQIVALPTRWPEPFGRVPLEAGVCRRPVVSFAVGGLRESIVHDVTGILVPAGDIGAFVDELAKLAHSAKKQRELGEAARRHVLARYSLRETKLLLEELWKTSLTRNRS